MTGPEHWREFERWLEQAREAHTAGDHLTVGLLLGFAQVHVTASLAAATAYGQAWQRPGDYGSRIRFPEGP